MTAGHCIIHIAPHPTQSCDSHCASLPLIVAAVSHYSATPCTALYSSAQHRTTLATFSFHCPRLRLPSTAARTHRRLHLLDAERTVCDRAQRPTGRQSGDTIVSATTLSRDPGVPTRQGHPREGLPLIDLPPSSSLSALNLTPLLSLFSPLSLFSTQWRRHRR